MSDIVLVNFIDIDYFDNLDQRKYAFGYLFNIGSGPTSWQSKLQDEMAQWKKFKQNIMPLQRLQKSHYGCIICWNKWAFHS